jgi:hypothetical protein
VLVAGLKRVNDTQNLSSIAASRCWVCEDQTDGVLRVDDEHRADGEGLALLIDVLGVLVVKPDPQYQL